MGMVSLVLRGGRALGASASGCGAALNYNVRTLSLSLERTRGSLIAFASYDGTRASIAQRTGDPTARVVRGGRKEAPPLSGPTNSF